MEDFLRKIKLIDDISTKLNISRPEFVSALKAQVEESDINNIFSGFLEVFSFNKKKYKGLVNSRGFHIRKKRKLFEKRYGSVNAKGIYSTNGDVLVINTKISAFNINKLILMSFIFVCYITFIFYHFTEINDFKDIPIFFILFFFAIPLIFYFSLKSEVANMKTELETHFNSITSKTEKSK